MNRVDLVLGLECNQKCIFCFNNGLDKHYDRKKFELSYLKKILNKYKNKGIKNLAITGGEPTISKHFFPILENANKLGYKEIRIVTNGMMFFYDDFTIKCSKYNITHLCVSFHGNNAKVHDKLTGVPGSFAKTLKGIENIKQYFNKKIQLTAHVVLTKQLLPYLSEHTSLLIKQGFNSVNFLYLMPNSKINNKLTPNNKLVKKKLKEVIDKFNDKLFIHIGYLEPCLMPGYESYFDFNDFDMEFNSNCNLLFDDWKKTLINHKVKKKKCMNCKHFKTCLGVWEIV